ncbi:pentapeptide repeat-containing protein [Pseudonocardia sp. CA-107938]|uniref:pentapeptide repeat-containing protein n=1 Tax=Pseudonocardia sp. CA-107938 TaxID=3240021 RepID=UPI003D92DD3F
MADLRADCSACAGLCCVVPAFTASADFAITKPARTPCPNLQDDHRCGVHSQLRDLGFPGCTVYDCFGAGQRLVQETFGGRSWRAGPEVAGPMFAVYETMRLLHELLWYLQDALARPEAAGLHAELAQLQEETEVLAAGGADALREVDAPAQRDRVNAVLREVGERVRAAAPGPRKRFDRRGADLAGADLRRRDLRGASLRGALLVGADLRGTDLTGADVIGADLRAADVRGANLRGALFLTQFQVNAARGDAATTLPVTLDRPPHWR